MSSPSAQSPVTASRIVPLAEILTVGLPFCAFKVLTGLIALAWFAPLGYALLAIGAIDLVLNAVNLFALLAVGRRVAPVCLTDVALRRNGELGLAVDVFLSFATVAIVVGAGLLRHLPAWTLPIWNIAVVLNVLGAGVGRLLGAVRRLRHAPAG